MIFYICVLFGVIGLSKFIWDSLTLVYMYNTVNVIRTMVDSREGGLLGELKWKWLMFSFLCLGIASTF